MTIHSQFNVVATVAGGGGLILRGGKVVLVL